MPFCGLKLRFSGNNDGIDYCSTTSNDHAAESCLIGVASCASSCLQVVFYSAMLILHDIILCNCVFIESGKWLCTPPVPVLQVANYAGKGCRRVSKEPPREVVTAGHMGFTCVQAVGVLDGGLLAHVSIVWPTEGEAPGEPIAVGTLGVLIRPLTTGQGL